MKINSSFCLLLILFSSLLSSCKKEVIKVVPTITVATVTNITANSASCGGEVTSDGGAEVTSRGVCWGTSQNPTTANNKTSDGTGVGAFTRSVIGLTPGTTYNVVAYAINTVGTGYSSQSTFTTLAMAPILATTELSGVTSTSANSGGNITNDGGSAITARGVCWSINQNPTIADNKTTNGAGIGSFTSSITGLIPGKTYYIRAYAANIVGTAYGNQITTITTAIVPVITTNSVSSITTTTLTSGGNISSDGGAVITARGVCWSKFQNPTTDNNKTNDGIGTGSFNSSITGLTPGMTYYFRAYATNIIGTAYGNEVVATSQAVLPMITTDIVSAITATTAICGGNVINDGGAMVTARGICRSKYPDPNVNIYGRTFDGSGTGIFNSNIIDLESGTTYYVKAYATNSVGTAYGNEVTFTSASLPVINTAALLEIMPTTATCGGFITSDSEATITARGVCWSTQKDPTIVDNKTTDGTGIGIFTSLITNLTQYTTYYVRAYATNSLGTGYGNTISFKSGSTVTDIDGNIYHTVTIGSHEWMVENLRTTRYRNGDPITNETENVEWSNWIIAGYCWYNNDIANKDTYGALYNWYAVHNTKNIAPVGWHVSTDKDWKDLIRYFGEESEIGGKLKERGITHWNSPNTDATNEGGFTGLPGGFRNYDGSFKDLGHIGAWWFPSEFSNTTADWPYSLYYTRSSLNRTSCSKNSGFSVRCVKD